MEILTNDDIVRHIMIYADIRAIMNMRMVARIDDALNANFWFNRFACDDYGIIIVKLPENTVWWIREYLIMKRYHEELMTFVDCVLFESHKFTNVFIFSRQAFKDILDKNFCQLNLIDGDNGLILKSIIESIKERKRYTIAVPSARKFFSYLSISKENRMWEITFDFEDVDNARIIITGWGFIKHVLTPI